MHKSIKQNLSPKLTNSFGVLLVLLWSTVFRHSGLKHLPPQCNSLLSPFNYLCVSGTTALLSLPTFSLSKSIRCATTNRGCVEISPTPNTKKVLSVVLQKLLLINFMTIFSLFYIYPKNLLPPPPSQGFVQNP